MERKLGDVFEVDGVKYAVITTQDVQSMIDAAIGNALNALY